MTKEFLKIDLPEGSHPDSIHLSGKHLCIYYILPGGNGLPVLVDMETKKYWKIICDVEEIK